MSTRIVFPLVLFLLTPVLTASAETPTSVSPAPVIGEIEVLDPALEQLVDPKSPIELLATGFEWSEGPLWLAEGEFVIFSDVPKNVVFKWKEGEGLSEYLRPAGYTGRVERSGESGSNGLALDKEGRLLLCQQGDLRLARMDAPLTQPKPQFTTIADNYQGKHFNSPNDLTVHSSGAIYFTDPPYGREGGFTDPHRPLDFQGVYRVMPGGEAELLTKNLKAPNGIAFSPDENTMYVAQSDSEKAIWMAYHVAKDGAIDEGRVLMDVTELSKTRPGSPDGMEVDQHGNLFATGPGGVLIITPAGKHLGTIRTGEIIANCAFGDDGRTLYMTSHMHFCRVRLKTKGCGFE